MPTPEAISAAVAPVAAAIMAAAPVAVTNRPSWYAINAKAGAEAEVRIYEAIGAFGVTAEQFVADLNAITAPRIILRINTPGGEVMDATAIHNAIREHPARVTAKIDGLAASSGSFVAVAADEIQVARNAYMMVHEATGGVMGTADDMQAYAAVLEKINGNIAAMYAKRSGRKPEEWRRLMSDETWFTADEAVAAGLADSVTDEEAQTHKAAASFDFKVYNKIPDGARRLWDIQNQQPAPEDSPCGDPPPATTTEATSMGDSNQAVPAPTPAAANAPVIPQGSSPTITEAENRRREVVRLNDQAIENFIAQGRTAGHVDGVKAERERCKEIAEACPGKPEMAVSAILANNSAESVRLAFAATVAAEERARTDAEAKDLELARWRSLAATGGYPNGVPAGVSGAAEDDGEPEVLDAATAKARAEREWEQKPSVRKGFTSKDRYVNVRVAEMTGMLRHAASAN